MRLNTTAYDEFLRHIIIESNENRFQTFLKAHARASDWFDDASSRAGKPSPLTHQRLSNLLYFLASLVTSIQDYSKEKEVIMYTPAPVKVEVLEELG